MSPLLESTSTDHPRKSTGTGSWVPCTPREAPKAPRGTTQPHTDDSDRILCPRCGHGHLHRRRTQPITDAFFGQIRVKCSRCMYEEKRLRVTKLFLIEWFCILTLGAVAAWFTLNPILSGKSSGKDDPVIALATAQMASGGKLSAFEQMILRKPKTRLDNSTILKLRHANASTDLIVLMIKTSTPDFDVSANAVIELMGAGINDSIIEAMIESNYSAATYRP